MAEKLSQVSLSAFKSSIFKLFQLESLKIVTPIRFPRRIASKDM